jgi:hypothetical protein
MCDVLISDKFAGFHQLFLVCKLAHTAKKEALCIPVLIFFEEIVPSGT